MIEKSGDTTKCLSRIFNGSDRMSDNRLYAHAIHIKVCSSVNPRSPLSYQFLDYRTCQCQVHDEKVGSGLSGLGRHETDEQQGVGADDDGEHDAEEGELLHLSAPEIVSCGVTGRTSRASHTLCRTTRARSRMTRTVIRTM